jgi:hypothetical protein
MGISHSELWRWKLMASIPDDEFAQLLATGRRTTRELSNHARRRRGDIIPDDIEHCPHCGKPIRRRK